MKLKGADILIECLKEQKVDTIFGIPGGATINIYDSLYKNRDSIKHILTSHEQGASHAADGYARATGKVGVCLATSGPGATNLVTGIATAFMDSVPMVAITGNVPVNLLGKDSFQEVDIAGVTMPITKHNYIVKNIDELAPIVREAFQIAQQGRPGPVLIDIPKNITSEITEYSYQEAPPIQRKKPQLSDDHLKQAISLLKTAKKPFIFSGGGVLRSQAYQELAEFVKKMDAPIASSLMGQSAYNCLDDHYTGMIGMHGTKVSNMAVSQSDLLIVVGARFSDRVTSKTESFAPNAKIFHIDIDPAEINKNVRSAEHIVGDVKEVLALLNKHLDQRNNTDWMQYIKKMKEDFPIRITSENKRSKEIIETISELTEHKAIVCTEVGQHQIWTAQFYGFAEPGSFLSSGGLGTMGYGTGAAIGAQAGRPDKQVINIAGDGSFKMNCNELATAAKYKLPIIVLLMNNQTLGMVRQWQTIFYEGRHSETDLDHPIDWIKLAEAYGANGLKLTLEDDVKTVLSEALKLDGPVLVNCQIPTDDKVFPMVPPGASIEEVILSSQGA